VSKASIHRRISELRSEIRELKSRKSRYEKMIKKINEAIEELKFARSYTDEACIRLKDNYVSDEANKKASELEWEKESIVYARTLAGNMVDEANSKVTEIQRQIERKQQEIEDLYEQLASMED